MEAKDTMMGEQELRAECFKTPHEEVGDGYCLKCVELAAQAQAEITWPIAKQAGIKEVVEWIKAQQYECANPEDMAYKWLLVPPEDWQAKLKEWGL